jgi:hypothetical protein
VPIWPRRDAYRQGPSFHTLMSLRAGRSTETGSQAWQIRSLSPVLSIHTTHAFQRPDSRRQSRTSPGAGGG